MDIVVRVIAMILAARVGAATYYEGDALAPLYTDQFVPETLTYGNTTKPWVAVDVNDYFEWVQPGQELLVILNGEPLIFQALDAGLLAGERVDLDMDGARDTPIIIDIPHHLRPDDKMSWAVIVIPLPLPK
ncbi:MAG: hypothetical protein DRQ02_01350 [Candidatus Latescibacterota bacterium]|nr:MAG: hypothetical protein DRQ02_01350 [Candidatus Latescibacterota bacterium]